MKEQAEIQNLAIDDFRQQIANNFFLLWQASGLKIRKAADRAQQMLIDSIMMIHVELHQRDDPAEIRNKATQNAGFIHASQYNFRHIARH
mgnify:CR=1 FL=1